MQSSIIAREDEYSCIFVRDSRLEIKFFIVYLNIEMAFYYEGPRSGVTYVRVCLSQQPTCFSWQLYGS